MKRVIRKIDLALKSLYNLDCEFRAEDFLLKRPAAQKAVGSAGLQGALYVQSGEPCDLTLGIYLSAAVGENLTKFPRGRSAFWSREKLSAFAVATEEISHFHYLLHHAATGRQVSQLELELQGDIDKFLLAFFANAGGDEAGNVIFETLFERLFSQFRLSELLTGEEKDRYTEANRLAKRFILKFADQLSDPASSENVLKALRRFYRLNASEKMSLIAA